MSDLEPITRREVFLNAIAEGGGEVPEPVTREEVYLKAILDNGGGGGGGDVTGVKGSAESSYRKGNVNITPENLGLGTASEKDVPTSGDAGLQEVVLGNDSRLTDARNAKDVQEWAKAETKPTYTASEVGAIPVTEKGVSNGVATLTEAGKVPEAQLPSYVDDAIEGYLYEGHFYADSAHTEEITGERGKIYVDLDTNRAYRWTGSTFVEIGDNNTFTANRALVSDANGKVSASSATSEEVGYLSGVTGAIQTQIDEIKSNMVNACYGFHIDGNESDPANMVTYVGDAVGMTPAYMDFTNDKFEWGSWKDAFFIPRPCILGQDGIVQKYLDPNDYSKDIDGNTVTIDTTLTGANVMIEFPKIWYKVVPDANDDSSGTVYISNKKLDDGFKDYAYIDYQGNHKEHFYMPAYNGVTIDNVLRSVSNGQITRLVSANSDISKASANGNGWYIEDEGERQLINFLLLLIGKSTDVQTVFGKGLITGGTESQFNSFRTGIHNEKGLFYGTNDGSASLSTNAVKVFGIENWWGLQWRRSAGNILSTTNRLIKMCYGTEDGSSVNEYNTNGNGYVNIGASPSGTSGGYISKMKFTNSGMFCKVANGSQTTYFCDSYNFNTGQTNYAAYGGRATNGDTCGAFTIALDNNATSEWAGGGYTGSAPSYK